MTNELLDNISLFLQSKIVGVVQLSLGNENAVIHLEVQRVIDFESFSQSLVKLLRRVATLKLISFRFRFFIAEKLVPRLLVKHALSI
jgi:hypothetical protein